MVKSVSQANRNYQLTLKNILLLSFNYQPFILICRELNRHRIIPYMTLKIYAMCFELIKMPKSPQQITLLTLFLVLSISFRVKKGIISISFKALYNLLICDAIYAYCSRHKLCFLFLASTSRAYCYLVEE